jgi:hypothetical protein
MTNLVLDARRIEPHSGYDLRVAQLCARIPGVRRLMVVPPWPQPDQVSSIDKNKVLDALGLGAAVVSTPLGVEGFPTVRDGEHLVVADDV